MLLEGLTLRTNLDALDLTGDYSIAGDHSTWQKKVRDFFSKQGLDLVYFINAATKRLHPDLSRRRRSVSEHKRYVGKLARRTRSQFETSRNPVVPDFLRRIVAHLMELVRTGEPIPVIA